MIVKDKPCLELKEIGVFGEPWDSRSISSATGMNRFSGIQAKILPRMPRREMARSFPQIARSLILKNVTILAFLKSSKSVLSFQILCTKSISRVFSSRPRWEKIFQGHIAESCSFSGFNETELSFQFTVSFGGVTSNAEQGVQGIS